MPKYYPVLMNLEHQHVLIVGGGSVAARKAELMIQYDAHVVVVAREAKSDIRELARERKIHLHEREFLFTDLDSAILVIAATDDRSLHERIKAECDRRRIPCNVVDVPELCSFIVPSIIRRGELMITISTDGLCPAYSKFQRQRLERCCFPEGSENMLHVVAEARNELRRGLGTGMTDDEKFDVLRQLAESDLPYVLAQHGLDEAKSVAVQRVHQLVEQNRHKTA